MDLSDINVSETLEQARRELAAATDLPPSLKASIELLILIVALLSNRLGLNSSQSAVNGPKPGAKITWQE